MTIHIKDNSFFVFDLDDTLYKEIDYLRSAYSSIALLISQEKYLSVYSDMISLYFSEEDVFEKILSAHKTSLTKKDLLNIYRSHIPTICMLPGLKEFHRLILKAGAKIGIITDGRKITQRNKLKALGIEASISEVVISEEFGSAKPSLKNFKVFSDKYPKHEFYYFGDNPKKDFIGPNQLNWTTACLMDDGRNIHPQNFSMWPQGNQPLFRFNSWLDVRYK